MALGKIWGKKEEPAEEYVELEFEDKEEDRKLSVKVEKMASYADAERIQQKMRDGMILLVDIKKMKESNMAELKRAIEKLKKTCTALSGDMAGVGENWLIIAPKNAVIHREKA